MIKKHLHPKGKTSDQSLPNLDSYLLQAQVFRSKAYAGKNKGLIQKAALAAVIPLAAASTMNGQCIISTTKVNEFPPNVSVYKILTSVASCLSTKNNNVNACFPSATPNNTIFLVASAPTFATNASCAWYCNCGGIGGNIIIDGNDGLGQPPLPVELTNIKALPSGKSIVLNWETASEINNSGFEILRSSDSYFYQKIAWVAGKGNNHEAQQYQWVDKNIRPNKTYYYRLNQLDFDGSNDYSPVVTAMVTDQNIIEVREVSPNPVKGKIARLEINTPVEIEARVQLFDSRGAIINEGEKLLNVGTNYLKINVSQLVSGTYFAKVQVGQELWYRKVWVQ